MSSTSPSVVVVGAGVLGALTAYRLVERGAQVTLVDAHAPGSGTTATGYAHVNASYAGYWDYFALRAAGITGYRQLRAELGAAPWYADVGCLQFECDPGLREALLEQAQRLRDSGYPVSLLTRSRVTEIEPDVRIPDAVEEVLYYTDEGYIDGPQLVADVVDRSVARGLYLRTDDAVVDVAVRDDQVRSVTLASGRRIDTELVVCCCGRWSDALLGSAGVELSVMTPDEPSAATPGLTVTTKPVAHRLRRMVIADGVNVRTGTDGRLVVWSGEVDAQLQRDQARSGSESGQVQTLGAAAVDAARRYVRSLADAEIESATICIRALPRDGLPAIGWVPGITGLYLVAAHAASTLAPAAAELATTELLDGTGVAGLDAFRPARFLAGSGAGASVPVLEIPDHLGPR